MALVCIDFLFLNLTESSFPSVGRGEQRMRFYADDRGILFFSIIIFFFNARFLERRRRGGE